MIQKVYHRWTAPCAWTVWIHVPQVRYPFVFPDLLTKHYSEDCGPDQSVIIIRDITVREFPVPLR